MSLYVSNRSTLCPAATVSLVFLGSTELTEKGVPTPARQSVANLDGGPRIGLGGCRMVRVGRGERERALRERDRRRRGLEGDAE